MKKSPELTEKILPYIPSHACIVDVGCGDGEFLSSLTGKGYQLIGVDPLFENNRINAATILQTSDQIDSGEPVFFKGTAKVLLQAASGEPIFFKGTAEVLPLPDHVADVVVMQCVFSLCDPESACKELKRVLKPDGVLIMTDLLSGTVSVDFTKETTPTHGLLSSDLFPHNNRKNSVSSEPTTGLGRILTREDLEDFLALHYTLVAFSDERGALLQMLIETIFSDEELCISKEEQEKLKALKAGYGLWVWKVKAE